MREPTNLTWLVCAAIAALATAGCTPGADDDGGGDDGTGPSPTSGDDGDDDGDDGSGDDDDGGSTAAEGDSTSGGAGDDDGSGDDGSGDDGAASSGGAGSSGGLLDDGGPTCDPVVQGEFNACVEGDGTIDNTLCNWIGDPDADGFIGCLTSSEMKGYNVCMISGCVDACDCFAPPETGDAVVVCSEILKGGGTACALDCSGGRTCPDGMECIGTLCFWPPSE